MTIMILYTVVLCVLSLWLTRQQGATADSFLLITVLLEQEKFLFLL